MKYCSKCVLPDTRPNLILDHEGVCNACRAHAGKPDIDWSQRLADFQDLVSNVKAGSEGYDCVIPVSGGKDSTWQTLQCLNAGLRPLAVTWAPPLRTELGKRNLENLINLGVDHIDIRINPKFEKMFMLASYQKYGTTAIPMHMAIFSIPLIVAYRFNIPLIIYGENPAFEYGTGDNQLSGFELTEQWLKTHGVMAGTSAKDWVNEGFNERDLTMYQWPSSAELKKKEIKAIFLGYYLEWDPDQIQRIASSVGFYFESGGARTGFYDYADIDDRSISVHHYLKWYKFGFTRLFDNLSLEIRNSRMTRAQAIQIIREKGEQCPIDDIGLVCEFMGISVDDFFATAERFRNSAIWNRKSGQWKIDKFIISDWNWDEHKII